MGIVNAARVLFGFPTLEEAKRIEDQKLLEEKRREAAQQERQAVLKIMGYPIKKFTQEEFSGLPGGEKNRLPPDFLKICPIGTWFVCRQNNFTDIVVVGQVVKGNDLFCDQWGAGLSVPERGINRYRLQLTN